MATATFTEEDNPLSSSDGKLTSVKVELTPEDLPPMNPSPHRHILGLREKVNYETLPTGVEVELDDGRNGLLLEIDSTAHSLFCPWTSGVYGVVACLGTQGLSIPLRVVEPHVDCRGCRWLEEFDSSAVVGEAGRVGMVLLLYLEPSTVSFEWIMMEEISVPSSEAIALSDGDCFAVKANVLPCTHDNAADAGKWVIPQLFIDGTYWMGDRARIPYSCPPISNNPANVWMRGEMRWKSPVGCGNGLEVLGQEVPDPTEQRVVESSFCLSGERVAALYLEETALRIARALRESKWKSVYGCYAQPDGSFLIGLASARAGGRFRQKISLRRVTGKLAPSVSVWKNVSAKCVAGELADFVRACRVHA